MNGIPQPGNHRLQATTLVTILSAICFVLCLFKGCIFARSSWEVQVASSWRLCVAVDGLLMPTTVCTIVEV